jgi:hypothetical protein
MLTRPGEMQWHCSRHPRTHRERHRSNTTLLSVKCEIAEPVEPGARSVLFPTMTRQYSSISSSLRGPRAKFQPLTAKSARQHGVTDIGNGICPTENAEEKDESGSILWSCASEPWQTKDQVDEGTLMVTDPESSDLK